MKPPPANVPEYTYRRLNARDLPQLVALYQASFGEVVTLAHMQAKFATAEFGADYVGYLACTPAGELAAIYGVFPAVVQIDGESVLAAQSGDTMTHPEHRKRGLFLQLARRTYELARACGIALIYGFPNENSRPGFKKHLEWTFLPAMQGAQFGMSGRRLAYRIKAAVTSEQRQRQRIQSALNDLRTDNDIQFDAGTNTVLKDSRYLAYKAQPAGSIVVRLGDLSVWLVPGPRLDVGAFHCHVPMQPQQLHSAFVDLLKASGAYALRFCYSPGSEPLDRLAQFCEFHSSTEVGYLVLDESLVVNSLYFSRGDFDYF